MAWGISSLSAQLTDESALQLSFERTRGKLRLPAPLNKALGVMKQSALLEFQSSGFAVEPGEDERTNPGIYGKSLAEWLSNQLRARGCGAGAPIAEDFGWCIPVESTPPKLYVACSNAPEIENGWRVFVFAERGIMARLFERDKSAGAVASLFADVKQVLETASIVQGLREENT